MIQIKEKMNNEDYLGITALALSDLAEIVAKSLEPEAVRPILMHQLTQAAIRWNSEGNWGKDATGLKNNFVEEVKASLDAVQTTLKVGKN